jgi:hypothetical protein
MMRNTRAISPRPPACRVPGVMSRLLDERRLMTAHTSSRMDSSLRLRLASKLGCDVFGEQRNNSIR